MSGKCDVCGKTPSFGHNVSFSDNRTNKMWRPNIQRAHIMLNGTSKQINICTRCLRTMQKAPKLRGKAAKNNVAA